MRLPLLLSLTVLGSVLPCAAADFGLGVSLRGDSQTVYVPVQLNPDWMLEGRLGWSHQRMEEPTWTQTWTRTDLGVGLFRTRKTSDQSRLYLGARIGAYRYSADVTNGGSTFRSGATTDGLYIAPTLGFEYFPVKSVSLGGEAGFTFSRDHGNGQSMENSGTFTALILRYHF